MIVYKRPQNGTLISKKKFAWLPTKVWDRNLGDSVYVLWETYQEYRTFEKHKYDSEYDAWIIQRSRLK